MLLVFFLLLFYFHLIVMVNLILSFFVAVIQAHPKDAEFLNKPIENYKEMMTIFGTGLATGKYAMGSNEALGSPSDGVTSSMKTEPYDEEKTFKAMEDVAKVFGESSKDTREATCGSVGNKRKRAVLTEEDTLVLSNMTDAVKDVAAAIRETKVEVIHPELYGAVMYMPGFTEEALICAFSHLVDNKAQGDAFVKMTDSHRVLWLRTWLAKNFYM
jgi:hypothetical protein